MAQILSDTPGRLRIRLRRDRRHRQFTDRVEQRFHGRDGIGDVRTNPDTGSVTVHYDRDRLHSGDVLAMLHDLGVAIEGGAEAEDLGEPDQSTSTTASGVIGSLDDLDRRLSRLTGRKVDLKLLFPAAIGAVGAYKLLTDGLQFGEAPAYLLLWYAFDSFYKLHTIPAQTVTDETRAERPHADNSVGGDRRRAVHHAGA